MINSIIIKVTVTKTANINNLVILYYKNISASNTSTPKARISFNTIDDPEVQLLPLKIAALQLFQTISGAAYMSGKWRTM